MELCHVERIGNGFWGIPYRFIGIIGSGISAEVFEAEGPGGERRAVKVLRTMLTGEREAAVRL